MLTNEQVRHFDSALIKAVKIVGNAPVHIRVSGRQNGDKKYMIGFIFGRSGHTDWMHITNVPEDDFVAAKEIYRARLRVRLAELSQKKGA